MRVLGQGRCWVCFRTRPSEGGCCLLLRERCVGPGCWHSSVLMHPTLTPCPPSKALPPLGLPSLPSALLPKATWAQRKPQFTGKLSSALANVPYSWRRSPRAHLYHSSPQGLSLPSVHKQHLGSDAKPRGSCTRSLQHKSQGLI